MEEFVSEPRAAAAKLHVTAMALPPDDPAGVLVMS